MLIASLPIAPQHERGEGTLRDPSGFEFRHGHFCCKEHYG